MTDISISINPAETISIGPANPPHAFSHAPGAYDSLSSYYVGIESTGNFAVTNSVVSLTGNQNISGVKNFYTRPTVNGSGVMLSGENAGTGGGTTTLGGASNIWIPAAQLVPKTTSGCGINSRETTTYDQNFDTCLFNSVTQEYADFTVVLPNNYDLGTIVAKFHWSAFTASTGTVSWGIKGVSLTNDDPLDIDAGTAQTVTDTYILTGEEHVTDYTSAVTIAGTPQAGERVQFTVFRDVTDTLGADAELIGIEIVYNNGGSNILNGNGTIALFTPRDNQPPASSFATLDTRNSITVLDFDDASTEGSIYVGVIPQTAVFRSGIAVSLRWMAATATSGNVRWSVSFERCNTDLDTDSFDTATAATATTNGTSGVVTVTDITCTSIDSLVVGDLYRVRVQRLGADGADTMVGDAELVAVELRTVN